ncbi:hypothetical protein GCM10027062_15450 [Nocardioides hungaricus]
MIRSSAIADAAAAQHDLDPDRASLAIAWQAARDQVVQAAHVITDKVIDPVGAIGTSALATP